MVLVLHTEMKVGEVKDPEGVHARLLVVERRSRRFESRKSGLELAVEGVILATNVAQVSDLPAEL